MMTEKQLLRMAKKDYMGTKQLDFFKECLTAMKQETQAHLEEVRAELQREEREIDDLDVASAEEERRTKLRVIERETKLLNKIEEALKRITEGEYGYCEETGNPIGLERLLARPTATLSIEAKTIQEHLEKNFWDREE